jgi:hydrogenase maturation protease
VTGGVLVAGIGNIFLSDDGFGVEVARRLAASPPPGVRVADFGIRGVHLAYEMLDGFDGVILVDAVPMGEPPGTLAVMEPERPGPGRPGPGGPGPPDQEQVLDAHSMSPDVVLGMLARLGGTIDRIYVVGCQPACLDEGMGLSAPVAAAVEDATVLCRQLAADMVQLVGKETIT